MELWKWAVVVTGVLVLFLFLYELRSKRTTEEFQDGSGSRLKSLLQNWVSQHSEIEETMQRLMDTQATIREALSTEEAPSTTVPKKTKPKPKSAPKKKPPAPAPKEKDIEEEEDIEEELSDVTDDEEVEGFVASSAHGYMRV